MMGGWGAEGNQESIDSMLSEVATIRDAQLSTSSKFATKAVKVIMQEHCPPKIITLCNAFFELIDLGSLH